MRLLSYSCGSNVPKLKCAHILLCKMYKNSLKLCNIADLQALTPGRVKKITLYNISHHAWRVLNLKCLTQERDYQHPASFTWWSWNLLVSDIIQGEFLHSCKN